MLFRPGQSGNPYGRPRGSRNRTSLAVREWATGIVEDPQVQARLLADAQAGRLHPSLLTALMAYAYGRPNLRDVPEPETPITIELNIPKPPGVMRTDSTGCPGPCLVCSQTGRSRYGGMSRALLKLSGRLGSRLRNHL